MMGHGTAPSSQTVENGGKATMPATPAAEGYLFDGWFKEQELQNEWKFDTDTVTADTTIYAKWTSNPLTLEDGYYRLYNNSVSTENFLFDVIFADPKGYDN